MKTVLRYAKHNIRTVYAQATEAEIAEGMAWYDEALAHATRLDPDNPHRAAAVIAALSPMTPWDRNLDLAMAAYTDGLEGGTLTRSITDATALIMGADPLIVLTGTKVRNFYLSIIGDPDAVCVDRHAFDVARGHKGTDADRKVLARAGVYEQIADAFRTVAAEIGIEPRHLQAVTWVTFRNRHLSSRHRRLASA